MDENLSSSLIFNNDQSFEAYLKDFTSSQLHATQEEADTICELADYDSILNSKGRPVPVLNGCSNVFSKDFGAQGGDLGGYAIVRTTSWDANGKKTGTETVIRSFIMKAALKAIVPAYKDLNIRFSHISFSDKPRHLFHFRNALYNYAQNLEADSVAQKHVTMLFMHLNQELADAVSAYTVNVEFAQMSRFLPSIDFPHLWTIFKQGELIYVSGAVAEDGVQMLMRFRSATCNCTCNSPMHRFHHSWKVEGECIDSNGKNLGRRAISVDVSYFDGLRNLIQLTALPLRFHPDQNNIVLQLAARGRKYVRLQGRNHHQYKGVARIFSEGQLLEPTPRSRFTLVDGRIMTDEETFYGDAPFSMDTLISLTSSLTNEDYLICRSHIRGFSFREAKWGYFDVDLVESIEFNTTIFKSILMIEDKYKNMLLSLVRGQEANSKVSFKDVIGGKGQGLVFLLHGGPGVGKTMTVESLAECCKRPLLRIDWSRLANADEGWEAALSKVLQLAHLWQAILLLEDADISQDQRTQSLPDRPSPATAYLRLLEYHQVILFLTTNQVNSFDPAFRSRIQLPIHYPPLSLQSRQTLWQIFLSKSSRTTTRMEDWRELSEEMAPEELNGREIRDVVRIAQASALGENNPIIMRHLQDALDVVKTFKEEFQEGCSASERPSALRNRKRRRQEIDGSYSEGDQE